MESLWLFMSALAVVYLIPGPDMVLILQSSLTHGRRSATAVAVGLAAARASHVALAGAGLAALLHASALAFELVRWGGVAYLVWLGVKIVRAPSLLPKAPLALSTDPKASAPIGRFVWRGLLTNLLNPKALLFCSVLLPQFIQATPEAGSLGGQFATLGAILVAIGAAFDLLYIQAGAALARSVGRSATIQTIQRWLFGGLLVGFGVRLAITSL